MDDEGTGTYSQQNSNSFMNLCHIWNAAFRNDGLVGHPGTSGRQTGPMLVKGFAFVS